MLHINDLTYRLGARALFDKATVMIPTGSRVGFVGRNGTGKTTLFRIIRGEVSPEGGTVTLGRGLRIGSVAQEAPGGPQTLLEVVLAADTERMDLLAEAETATEAHRIADIQMRLVDIDAHSAPARAGMILHGLGFDAQAQQRPCSSFSGGWRMRVALAAVLFAQPDLLLLDEPTNYLDLEGTLWLMDYLQRYPHTVLVISHDRDLLNQSVDQILHLDQSKLTLYRGGYDQFERQRREKQLLQSKMIKKQEDERKHLQAFVDRFRAKASKARQAQSRVKRLEKMEVMAALIDQCPWSSPMTTASGCSGPTATASRPSPNWWPASWRRCRDRCGARPSCWWVISPSISSTNSTWHRRRSGTWPTSCRPSRSLGSAPAAPRWDFPDRRPTRRCQPSPAARRQGCSWASPPFTARIC
jgi:ATP-binding cassette subfamily F protein 3